MSNISPVYLFSDSQLLFWKRDGQLFLKSILTHISSERPSAVYFGASNGNKIEFFELFQSAMEGIGIQDCHMLGTDFSPEDQACVEKADIILLAGGDVAEGWRVLKSTGLNEALLKKYLDGSVVIGVSAGAVQLGLCAMSASSDDVKTEFDTLQLIPYVIGVHEEKQDWWNLKQIVQNKGGYTKAIGMPFGAGAIYHPDHSLEPLREGVHEVFLTNGNTETNLLFPKQDASAQVSEQ